MKKITIICDIDGTIRDIQTPLYRLVKEEYPNIKVTPIEEWYDYEIYKYFKGLTKKEVQHLWFEKWAEGIYLYSKPFKDFLEVKDEFEKHNIIFATASPNTRTRELTIKWLELNKIRYDGIYFCDYYQKHLINGSVYIEDSPKQMDLLAENTPNKKLLVSRPWTKKSKWSDFSWKKILEIINEM